MILGGNLTRDYPSGWSLGGRFDSSLGLRVGVAQQLYVRCSLGDVNGDGRMDFVLGSDANDRIFIVYGHVLLKNPRLSVETPGQRARVGLSLSVDGEPWEMNLGGDIVDPFRGLWIPYSSMAKVTLSGAPGVKTVTARFRNAFRRESDTVQDTVALDTGPSQVQPLSNRLRSTGRAVVECHMETVGRLRATVWTSEGSPVAELVDEERGPGVWTLEWDGRNRDGKRVAPGVYIFQTEIDGRVERKKILVQG